jgi:hypothetical protein
MTTSIEYALLAGASYFDTRSADNRIPVPMEWTVASRFPSDPSSGFEASAFQRGTEIVISFAGTYDKDFSGDMLANAGLATGLGSDQLLQAAQYYLDVKRQNPGATITLTGHSLGGGLAALIGVFFGVQANTFDQAPFEQTALFGAPKLLADLAGIRDASGNPIYSVGQLAPLTSYIDQKAAFGVSSTFIPNSGLVSTIRVDGEFTSSLGVGTFNLVGTPADVIEHGPYCSMRNQLLRTLNTITLTVTLGVSMSACSTTSWKEEVLLHDGSKIVVTRSMSRGGHGIAHQELVTDESLTFSMPGTSQNVMWADKFSEDLGSSSFNLMMLEIRKEEVYIVTSPMGCLSYNKSGRPNPPYVIFKYQGKDWIRITLQELPPEFKLPNLIISSPDLEVKKTGLSLVPSEKIKQLNVGFKQSEFQTILREEVKGVGNSCPVMIRYKCGWGGVGEFNRKYFENSCK